MNTGETRSERTSVMSDTAFLKAICPRCHGHLEFPAVGVGETAPCPHCGKAMLLEDLPLGFGAVNSTPAAPKAKPAVTATITHYTPKLADTTGCMGCLVPLWYITLLSIALGILGQLVAWIFGIDLNNGYRGSAPTSYYEKELRDGVKAYDPTYKLTPADERMLRKMAEDLGE